MATTTTNLLSWEQFEQTPDDAHHYEVIEGELQRLPPPKFDHSGVARNVYRALLVLDDHNLGRLYMEAGYKLSQDPPTWIQPDVSFLAIARATEKPKEGYCLGAPELAIEIVSPSESARELHRKVTLLLANGARLVWVVYPDTRQVIVYCADGTIQKYGTSDKLTLPEWLDDWDLPVERLFEN